ncbi:hypothetical protein SISSUDRAFT_1055485 [Sistotremastrum suecicum HHB10207 ss-3]|uniref:Uncharacterized protein n=1 Tax=Sistotremastrum suecicum HHB10207 ss-3 TaxID=1314776 RepID=A0A165XS02_9AGAM|nr:hypothetical protein SISSUDRAFT_1055485 [Sistotremastrum suecicum HHB10207 ss-3]
MDGRWEDSSWRMEEAFWRVSDPRLRRLSADGGTVEGRTRYVCGRERVFGRKCRFLRGNEGISDEME